jgi:hypothetical protein
MPLYIGRTTKGAIVKEASWGAGGTANTFIPIVSESIQDKIEKIISPAAFGTLFPQSQYHGAHDVGGSFTQFIDPDNIGLLTYMTLGSEANAANGGAANVYDHAFTVAAAGTDLGSFGMEIQRGGSTSVYSGMAVNTFTLNMVRGGLLQGTFDVIGKAETDDSANANFSPGTKTPFTFGMGAVSIGGANKTYVTSATLVYTNNLDADGAFVLTGNATRGHVPYRLAPNISGTLECEWTSSSDELRDEIIDNAGLANLQFTFISPQQISGAYYYTMTILIPAIRLQGDLPVVSTMDRLPFTVNYTGMNNANAITMTLKDGLATKWSA